MRNKDKNPRDLETLETISVPLYMRAHKELTPNSLSSLWVSGKPRLKPRMRGARKRRAFNVKQMRDALNVPDPRDTQMPLDRPCAVEGTNPPAAEQRLGSADPGVLAGDHAGANQCGSVNGP